MHAPIILPKYMLLDLPCDAIRSVARFVPTLLELKQEPGPIIPPLPQAVTCAKLMIYKMSSMSFSTAIIPTWFLSAGINRVSVSSHRCP